MSLKKKRLKIHRSCKKVLLRRAKRPRSYLLNSKEAVILRKEI